MAHSAQSPSVAWPRPWGQERAALNGHLGRTERHHVDGEPLVNLEREQARDDQVHHGVGIIKIHDSVEVDPVRVFA